ncbi:MAG: hypothetical protein AABX75_02130 [Nanoarchaeota archaeon]
MNNIDKVYELLRQNGPMLPVEVASKLGVDSFLASAYLSQLTDMNKVKPTKERVGSTFVYFIAGQEVAASNRVSTLLKPTQKTARMFASSVPAGAEVEQKRQAFAERLQEIEKKETEQKAIRQEQIRVEQKQEAQKPQRSISEQIKQDFLDRFRPAIMETLQRKEVPKAPLPSPVKIEPLPAVDDKKLAQQMMAEIQQKIAPKKILSEGRLVEKAVLFLAESKADIISKDLKRKGKEADIVALIPSHIGNLKYLILVRDKKTITDADLSMAYTEAANMKLPALFMTHGKLTKGAEAYLQTISGLVKVKNLN